MSKHRVSVVTNFGEVVHILTCAHIRLNTQAACIGSRVHGITCNQPACCIASVCHFDRVSAITTTQELIALASVGEGVVASATEEATVKHSHIAIDGESVNLRQALRCPQSRRQIVASNVLQHCRHGLTRCVCVAHLGRHTGRNGFFQSQNYHVRVGAVHHCVGHTHCVASSLHIQLANDAGHMAGIHRLTEQQFHCFAICLQLRIPESLQLSSAQSSTGQQGWRQGVNRKGVARCDRLVTSLVCLVHHHSVGRVGRQTCKVKART